MSIFCCCGFSSGRQNKKKKCIYIYIYMYIFYATTDPRKRKVWKYFMTTAVKKLNVRQMQQQFPLYYMLERNSSLFTVAIGIN